MHLLKYSPSRLALTALDNRLEIIRARLSRRDLIKFGLVTGAGTLVAKAGLSIRPSGAVASPPTSSFVDPLPIMPIKRPLANGANGLSPFPTIQPNNPGGEGRTRPHQAFINYPQKFTFPPQKVFEVRQQAALTFVSPDLPQQTLWGFDGIVPGPTYHARYGEQILVRNRNNLPTDNGGFGLQQVTTHLHNGHTPSESDGFPCDYFPNPAIPAIANATFTDHHYPNALAGFASTNPPDGDINESLSTLWYHDHRVEFTAQNVYKGLAGFYLLFNQFDTGDETTGFHLPGVRDPNDFYANVQFDIPLILNDKVFDNRTGLLFFDLFNRDGILGDKFLVNGKIQPFLVVKPRRYRFRILNGGPSRFYQVFLTDKGTNTSIPFWQIANDGNLLPRPIKVTSTNIMGVAERFDFVIDFKPWAGKTLYFENRLTQTDGVGPDDGLKAPGQGDFLLQFRVDTTATPDNSVNFETTVPQFYTLPTRATPRVTRTFIFDDSEGWTINEQPMPPNCDVVRFRVKQNTAENWILQNDGTWSHPVHIHFEEFQILSRNGSAPGAGNTEFSRKDVGRLGPDDRLVNFFRFRDFEGRYPMHCHNTIHEDHAMMLRWDIDQTGDLNTRP